MALGDFGLVKGTDLESKLVRFGEWANGDGISTFSHAFVVVSRGNEIVEAMPGGARLGNLSEYADKAVMSSWDLTDSQRVNIAMAARSLLGTPYSALDYLSIAALRLHIRPKSFQEYVASTKHMICSQLADQSYLMSGLHMFNDNRFPGDVTPQDLRKVLKGPV